MKKGPEKSKQKIQIQNNRQMQRFTQQQRKERQ